MIDALHLLRMRKCIRKPEACLVLKRERKRMHRYFFFPLCVCVSLHLNYNRQGSSNARSLTFESIACSFSFRFRGLFVAAPLIMLYTYTPSRSSLCIIREPGRGRGERDSPFSPLTFCQLPAEFARTSGCTCTYLLRLINGAQYFFHSFYLL